MTDYADPAGLAETDGRFRGEWMLATADSAGSSPLIANRKAWHR
jgi:hypothetical protein